MSLYFQHTSHLGTQDLSSGDANVQGLQEQLKTKSGYLTDRTSYPTEPSMVCYIPATLNHPWYVTPCFIPAILQLVTQQSATSLSSEVLGHPILIWTGLL
eukprot:sb/3478745/